MAPMFVAGTAGALLTMVVGLSLMGLTYGPLGTVLSELFPTRGALHRQLADVQLRRHLRRVAGAVHRHVARDRTTGCSTSATTSRGAAALTIVGLLATRETKDDKL